MIPCACSDATSTNRCRSRTSTVPTMFPGNPVYAGDGIHDVNRRDAVRFTEVHPETRLIRRRGATRFAGWLSSASPSPSVASSRFLFAHGGADFGENDFVTFGSGFFTDFRISSSENVFSGAASVIGGAAGSASDPETDVLGDRARQWLGDRRLPDAADDFPFALRSVKTFRPLETLGPLESRAAILVASPAVFAKVAAFRTLLPFRAGHIVRRWVWLSPRRFATTTGTQPPHQSKKTLPPTTVRSRVHYS